MSLTNSTDFSTISLPRFSLDEGLSEYWNPSIAFLVALAAISVATVHAVIPRDRYINLPGPRGWPIFGSWFDLGDNWSEHFRQAAKKYGDVFKVQIGNRTVVVVNSPKAAHKLFNEQGSAMISRPWFYTFHGVLSKSSAFTIGTSAWSESTKNKRKAAATALNRPAVQSYMPIIEEEALDSMRRIYQEGKAGQQGIVPYTYFQRLALNTSFQVNYGFRMEARDDALFEEISTVIAKVASVRAVTGSLQDYVPIMRYFPANSRSKAAASYGSRRKVFMTRLFDELQERVNEGKDESCITGNILRDTEAKKQLERIEIDSICLSMVSAGLDTFANTMIWLTGFLATRPDIQAKAHAELKEQYPGNEMPNPESESLTYIMAMAKEASRLFNVFRICLPRENINDVVYSDAVIPAGTLVLLNSWACNVDEEKYPDPFEFKPERYLEKNSELQGLETYAFGMGRRMCPGVFLAMREIYTALVFLLHFYTIEKSNVPGEQDFDIHPLTAVEDPRAFSVRPKNFKVRCVPRPDVDMSVLSM